MDGLIADLFLGKITSWRDPRIAALHYTPVPRDLRESVAAKIRLLHDPNGQFLTT